MDSFPGGVLSRDAKIGVALVAGFRLVALDLASGELLWSKDSKRLPVAASHNYLILLDSKSTEVLQVCCIRTGQSVHSVDAALLPAELTGLSGRMDGADFSLTEFSDRLEVSWRIQPRYYGGAAQQTMPIDQDPVFGGLTIDLKSGLSVSRHAQQTRTEALPSENVNASTVRTLDGEVARNSDGSNEYILRIVSGQDGNEVVKIDAFRSSDQKKLWESELADIGPPSNPAPLRQ